MIPTSYKRLVWAGKIPETPAYICVLTCTSYRLVLGGGYGFLTGQHGLSIDNLLQVS